MPKNTWAGVVISAFALTLGFAFVWHIWWMVIASGVGILASWIAYSFERNKDYYVEVAEVEAIERAHLARVYGEQGSTSEENKDEDQDEDIKVLTQPG